MSELLPLHRLYNGHGYPSLPLPPELESLYGPLGFPALAHSPYVIGNFVTTLDGVVALDEAGHGGGGEISGFNADDRMLMGILRSIADAVVVGAGTLRADTAHIWTAAHIYPSLTGAYQALRDALGKSGPPLNVIVSASGSLDTTLPVFQSGEAPVLVVTTLEGAQKLDGRSLPRGVSISTAPEGKPTRAVQDDKPTRAVLAGKPISAASVLEAIRQHSQTAEMILVEGGPHLMGDFFAERRLDELFLTLAPQVAGRLQSRGATERPGLVAGKLLAPDSPVWGTLISVHQSQSHLFLRYAFDSSSTPE
jgi:riboflavin biosynthesis pyrimidine reductase